jgi:hypothetical protein
VQKREVNNFFRNKRTDGDEQALLPILLTLHKAKSGKSSKEVCWKDGELLASRNVRKSVRKGVLAMDEGDIPAFAEFLNTHEVMKSLREEYGIPEFTVEDILAMIKSWGG